MKVLIIGQQGQVAQALMGAASANHKVMTMGRACLDLNQLGSIQRSIEKIGPDWIINTAAYTAVDQAETDSDAAHLLNAQAPAEIATAAQKIGCRLIHLSTDFVFDGHRSTPYQPNDVTNPLNVYGASKLAGEKAVFANQPDATVIRTSWVFGTHGNNFVKTMLRLMQERDSLNVVADQIGSPSSAHDLAEFIWRIIDNESKTQGVFHWTNAGVCSWYDFAVAINEIGQQTGLLKTNTAITPIPSSAYPTPAKRPHYSVLDKSTAWALNAPARHWRQALLDTIQTLTTR